MTNKKVLVIAYACNPLQSSEPGIGWHFVKHLSDKHNLTVLTRKKNEQVILDYIINSSNNNLKNINWIFYDLPFFLLKLKKRLFGVQFYFKLWLIFSYKRYKNYFNNEKFDIVNHNTLGVVWNSSPYYKLNSNFIWGPVGGGDSIPWSFLWHESFRSILSEILYKSIVFYSQYLSKSNRACRINSKASIFRTKQVYDHFSIPMQKYKYYYFGETGFTPHFDQKRILDFNEIRAITVSRFDYWKGIIYAIKGFEIYLNTGGKGSLMVLGDGKEFNRIKKYIIKNNLTNSIFLLGNVKLTEFKEKLMKSNVLIYPSFRDGGSFVVLEAMVIGLPIILNNLSGPYEMVGDKAGLVTLSRTPQCMSNNISSYLHKLIDDPLLGRSKSKLVKKRAYENFTWTKVTNRLSCLINDVLNENPPNS